MATYEAPICVACQRLGPREDGEVGVGCAAFPNGIPDAIWGPEGFDHREAYPGDHGVRFLLDPARVDAFEHYVASILS
jgi:hypothetical protein